MRIQSSAGQAQQRHRESPKDGVQWPHSPIRVRQENIAAKIVFRVFDALLRGAKSKFEAAQAFIAQRRSAEVEVCEAVNCTMPDRFPHEQVIRAQTLKFQIRGTKFIKNVATFMKKYGRGHRLLLLSHDAHETMVRGDCMALEVLEKTKWLRWQSKAAPRPTVQRVINLHSLNCVGEFYL